MPRGKHANHVRGNLHHRWNQTGVSLTPQRYVKVRVGKEHPLADPNGYAYLHHLVICSAIGRPLQKGEVVHHRNGDKTDNRLENLDLLLRGQHNAHHNAERGRNARGQFMPKAAGALLDGREWREWPDERRSS